MWREKTHIIYNILQVTVVRPSGVVTAMTEGIDTTSEGVDKQSVEIWNEVTDMRVKLGININFSVFDKQNEEQTPNHDGEGRSWPSCCIHYQPPT